MKSRRQRWHVAYLRSPPLFLQAFGGFWSAALLFLRAQDLRLEMHLLHLRMERSRGVLQHHLQIGGESSDALRRRAEGEGPRPHPPQRWVQLRQQDLAPRRETTASL